MIISIGSIRQEEHDQTAEKKADNRRRPTQKQSRALHLCGARPVPTLRYFRMLSPIALVRTEEGYDTQSKDILMIVRAR